MNTEIQSTKSKIFNYYEKYMLVMGMGGQIFLFVQAAKIFFNQSARDVSLPGFFIALISLSSWLIYGIFLRDRALILANVVGCMGAILVIVGILLYAP